jgi:hypothetical protein
MAGCQTVRIHIQRWINYMRVQILPYLVTSSSPPRRSKNSKQYQAPSPVKIAPPTLPQPAKAFQEQQAIPGPFTCENSTTYFTTKWSPHSSPINTQLRNARSRRYSTTRPPHNSLQNSLLSPIFSMQTNNEHWYKYMALFSIGQALQLYMQANSE